MFSRGQPSYHNYPANVSYNPYLHSSYQRPSPFEPIPSRGIQSGPERDTQDRARVLAEQRARRAQYLPEEDDYSDEDNWEYNQYGPRELAYLNAKRQGVLELQRRQQEEARERENALKEQQRQKAIEERRRAEEARQRLLEERNQVRLQREEARRMPAGEREGGIRHEQHQRQAQRGRSHSRDPPKTATQSQPPSSRSRQPSPSQAAPEPKARPTTPSLAPKRTYSIEEQNQSASLIQNRFRIHSSSKTLDNIASQFETLKKNFVYPSVIDFQKPGSGEGHIRVLACRPPSDFDNDEDEQMDVDGSEGKVAYTSTNYGLNQYSDALDKLLMKLDGVESWCDKGVRMKRRRFVKDIEKEASKLDRYKKQAWLDYVEKEAKSPHHDTQEKEGKN